MPSRTASRARTSPAPFAALLFVVSQWFVGAWALAIDEGSLALTQNTQASDSDAVVDNAEATNDSTDSSEPTNSELSNSEPTKKDTELAIDPSQARPSLDYVPSETISEDKSVSFPVDI